jgi:hypothetical protein
MTQPISWPEFGKYTAANKQRFAVSSQAEGNLSYLEFISAVKSLWEQSHPNYPIKGASNADLAFTWFNSAYEDPETGNTTGRFEDTDAIITYSLELRKAHSVEPKPRMRQITEREIYIYGQRFQNIVSFTAMSKVGKRFGSNQNSISDDQDNVYLVESLIEAFEDFMLEYTPVLKKIGASELVYSRRLSDSEVNRDNKDVHKRTVTYMLTTEKTYAAKTSTIDKIAIDLRSYMSYESNLLQQATPNYKDITIQVNDLYQTATPNT